MTTCNTCKIKKECLFSKEEYSSLASLQLERYKSKAVKYSTEIDKDVMNALRKKIGTEIKELYSKCNIHNPLVIKTIWD